MSKFKRWLPTVQSLQDNRWLKWLGPALLHPKLWCFSRKGIAMGVAIGLFFGFLAPVAQIPISAGAAVLLRGNLPMAAAATFVTNPVTFAPVYYVAYRIGAAVLPGEPVSDKDETEVLAHIERLEADRDIDQDDESDAAGATPGQAPSAMTLAHGAHDLPRMPAAHSLLETASGKPSLSQRLHSWATHIGNIGKPLIVGLAIIATVAGISSYFLISAVWIIRVRWTRRRRIARRGDARSGNARDDCRSNH